MFNPVFFPTVRAMQKVWVNACLGIPHKPKPQRPLEEGPAFAQLNPDGADIDEKCVNATFPRSDIIELAEEEQARRDAST